MHRAHRFLSIVALSAWCLVACQSPVTGADPCNSGLLPGQKPGPYSAVVTTGSQRGQTFCYICDTADKPAVIVFARTLTEPLGKLVRQLDEAVVSKKSSELRAWVTFLAEDQSVLDPKIVAWSREYAISSIPIAVFENTVGPPTYHLARDADVTILLAVKQKVVVNFAFRSGELTAARMKEVIDALPKILEQGK